MTHRNDPELPPAPGSVVGPDGEIKAGLYRGEAKRIDWSRAGRNRLWRYFHWKRWQYASIIGPDCVAAVAVADLGWATTAFAYLFDRRKQRVLADVSLVGMPRLAGRVADDVRMGATSTFHGGGTRFSIARNEGAWLIVVSGKELTIEATLNEGVDAATICAIGRVPSGVANCTHKAHGLVARGTARAGGDEFRLDGSLGALDHTNGLLARETAWRWASGTTAGRAINLVEGFHEPFENASWTDGVITALAPVTFAREKDDPMALWHIRSSDGSVNLAFTPEGVRSQNKNLGFAMSRWIQPIGTYSGTVLGTDVGKLSGVLEDHRARW